MRIPLTPEQAAGATKIAAALLEDESEGAPGEGAYLLEVALEEAGCAGISAIELEERDVPWVRAALTAYERYVDGALEYRESAAITTLRAAMRCEGRTRRAAAARLEVAEVAPA
jgi:hypothetical protein